MYILFYLKFISGIDFQINPLEIYWAMDLFKRKFAMLTNFGYPRIIKLPISPESSNTFSRELTTGLGR